MRVSAAVLAIAVFTLWLSVPVFAEDSLSGGCRVSCVKVPYYGNLPQHYEINTADGSLEFIKARQSFMLSGTTKHWCMCANAEGYPGPNDPPEFRDCWYFYSELGMGMMLRADFAYEEYPYCYFDGDPSSATCKRYLLYRCPML